MILALNCGSSSVKFQVFHKKTKESIAKGLLDRIGQKNPGVSYSTKAKGPITVQHKVFSNHKEAIAVMKEILTDPEIGVIKKEGELVAVGHRVVHGGDRFSTSKVIDAHILAEIKLLQDIAPLHNPPNIEGIEAAQSYFPNVPHVAVFDTAFHQTMPEHAFMYAVPYEWYSKYGVRRYGFHGPSHFYVSRRANQLMKKKKSRVITLHIGNGVSITAVRDGKSVDTSMGFTPLEGAIMGTRSGDIDPAVLSYIMQKESLTAKEVENILNKKSGLLGITEKYSDQRDILKAAADGDARAQLAIDMEVYRLKKYIGSYIAAMGGVDAIVFTGGVGENSAIIREKVCTGLERLGIKISPRRNIKGVRGFEGNVASRRSKVKVFVIPTNEELVFVEEVLQLT